LAEHAQLFGLDAGLDSLEYVASRPSLRAQHVIFAQKIHGHRVRRGWVSVHLDSRGRVYLAKNRAVPGALWPEATLARIGRPAEAVRLAKRALPKGGRLQQKSVERMWFPVNERLVPVFRVPLLRLRPREWWNVFVHAKTGKVLHKYDNVSELRGRARIFDPSPVTALGDHATLLGPGGRPRRPPPEAYREVTLLDLDRSGRLEGKYVSTKLTNPKRRVRVKDRDFRGIASYETGFDEVMAYFHVDRAIRYLEQLGYRGQRALFREPLLVDANGTREDNAYYDPATHSLLFGTGDIDEAEDGETILHEFGHAIQDAICPEFGQSNEAAAMGEGFGDYFAASFFEDKKPVRYRQSVMSWDGLLLGLDEGAEPPCLRRVDGDQTFDDYRPRGDVHDNGEIWSATLWDVRSKLGRRRADRVIIESHFQLDPFTTFARGARAILDANQHLFVGENDRSLRALFKARAIDVHET
jgi:Zn-dependent metalloprotease